eukprot:2666808-Amphidinium_carterae.1
MRYHREEEIARIRQVFEQHEDFNCCRSPRKDLSEVVREYFVGAVLLSLSLLCQINTCTQNPKFSGPSRQSKDVK